MKFSKEKLPCWAYWASVFFGVLSVVLLLVNVSLSSALRSKQGGVAQRQSAISTGMQLAQFDQSVVKAIAESAIKNNDSQLRSVLSTEGITIKADPTADAKSTDKK
jgi:hypothetical protein